MFVYLMSVLGPDTLLGTLFSNTFNVCSFQELETVPSKNFAYFLVLLV